MVAQNIPRIVHLEKELLLYLKNYIVATLHARDEMYAAMREEFEGCNADFYNISVPAKHIRVVRVLLTCIEKYKPYQHLQNAFAIWDLRMAPAVFALPSTIERRKYSKVAKLLAACLFDSDEYTNAIVCLGHIVRLHVDDIHSRLLLMYWLCIIGHWPLVRKQLDREKSAQKMYPPHSEMTEEIINQITILHTLETTSNYVGDALPAQQNAIERVRHFESILNESKTKTYQRYEAEILIKRSLIAASHFSSVDLSMIGDPLQNMEVIKSRYETLVKCRSNVFYGNSSKEKSDSCSVLSGLFQSDGADFQEAKNDEYLKLNAAVAEHFKAVLQLCLKYIELGILREAESEGLKLLHQVLKTANLQRCLAVLNVLLMASTLARGNILIVRPDPYRSLVASLWNKTSAKESSTSVNEESQETVLTTSESVEIMDHYEDELDNLQLGNQENKSVYKKLALKDHDEDCDCVICSLCDVRPQMRMEIIFSKFLLHRFSSKIFRLLSQRFQELHHYASLDIIAVCTALQIETADEIITKQIYPPELLDLLLVAVIRWLRKIAADEKPGIVREVVRESLNICSMDPVRFRWQWLTIRQLARSPLQIPKLKWMHAHNLSAKGGLRSPLKTIVSNLASELTTLTLCSPRPARNLNLRTDTPLVTKRTDRKLLRNAVRSQSCLELEKAEQDFNSFSHLFYREWRFQICSYLGLAYAFHLRADCLEPEWSAAYYFNEATSISTRQLARMILRKSEDTNEVFHFENVGKFKEAVRSLPSDLTVVQLFLDSARILWLIKLHTSRAPLVVPIATILQDDALLKRLINLLLENDETGNLSKTCTDAKKYWAVRRQLDSKLKTLIDDVENVWFEIFNILLLPCTAFSDAHHSVMEEIMRSGFSRSVASALAENLDLRVTDWKQLVQRFTALEGLDETVALHMCDCRNRWMSKFKKESFNRDISCSYVLLHVSPELASFPFELLPVMESHKRICRISSYHMFHKLLSRSKKIPKSVDGRNSFYVLDPGGDLTDTQQRLRKELQKFTFWKGTIGAAPKPEELRTYLETSDLFFYMGHGSGGRYFGRSTVLRSNCRAVSLLMGCSSVRVLHEGEGFDGRGAVYDYVIAKCPCIVGCLWMVTDGEIDRVFLALLKFCFSEIEKQGNEAVQSSSYRLLIDGIAYARTACKLKYMTGGAVVAYGLPIVTHFSPNKV